MPRYDYVCSVCGNRFELKQSFDSMPFADCPVCGRESRRMFNAVSVVFKGSGFYVNDYGGHGATSKPESTSSGASDAKGKSDSTPKPETTSKAETKAETKAEAKKETAASKASGD